MRPIEGDEPYRLHAPYEYVWDGRRIIVPAGFRFDGASVPRLVWTLTGITPDGLIRAAGLIHDWLYVHQGRLPVGSYQEHRPGLRWLLVDRVFTRAEVDALFLRVMAEAGVPTYRRWPIYAGVRVGGWLPWRTRDEIRIE